MGQTVYQGYRFSAVDTNGSTWTTANAGFAVPRILSLTVINTGGTDLYFGFNGAAAVGVTSADPRLAPTDMYTATDLSAAITSIAIKTAAGTGTAEIHAFVTSQY